MLTTLDLQEFTFGIFAAKIRLPYGIGIWPAWWILGHDPTHKLSWPTIGEIDILEMWGGNTPLHYNDQHAYATVHWNNQSNTMILGIIKRYQRRGKHQMIQCFTTIV